ncbi:hypothetical protein Tco_0693976 [Tanacetum coccineum]
MNNQHLLYVWTGYKYSNQGRPWALTMGFTSKTLRPVPDRLPDVTLPQISLKCLPTGAEFLLEAETFLLALEGAEFGSFMVTPFNVSALNVEFDFKIDLILFGPESSSTLANFSSRGRGVLQIDDFFS